MEFIITELIYRYNNFAIRRIAFTVYALQSKYWDSFINRNSRVFLWQGIENLCIS